MDIQELVKKVRHIELRSRLLSEQIFSGEYHTAFKGRGMQFSEVRAYSYGDDVRHIEWNVSARMQSPYVKLFEEEREQTVMILVDVSPSVFTSFAKQDRNDLVAEIVATLAFAATKSRDQVGLLLFDDEVREYIPPKTGIQQVLQILRTFLQTTPRERHAAQPQVAVDYLRKVYRHPAVIFLLSDFLMRDYKNALKSLARKNDLISIAVKDPLDEMLPDIGLVQMADAETGQLIWVDTSGPAYTSWYQREAALHKDYFQKACAEAGADSIALSCKEDYLRSMQLFFKRRARRA
jgi:uncharacterized protein (DUF58 family)